ncbi:hypothetical protein BX600DRAFT_508611 [Xylariales sp. PMI_506]|nr:hypothetical protein BX600DRAFT_508611 [Xylariales sp. PMI_506]
MAELLLESDTGVIIMSAPPSPTATPKRKRDDITNEHKVYSESLPSNIKLLGRTIFSFETPYPASPEDGSSSPRTKVANKLRGLTLESGGGVTATSPADDGKSQDAETDSAEFQRAPDMGVFDFDGAHTTRDNMYKHLQADDDDEVAMRKRHKPAEPDAAEFAPDVKGETSAEAAGPVHVDENGRLTLETVVDPTMVKTTGISGGSELKKSYPSINRLSDSKSRGRKRAGTPPLGGARRKSSNGSIEEEPIIVDPVRAALTWHEDEITVYDSEDKDDDGTGLNGIGFRPTPAVAYQRAQKRKQQLSEYKKREENEARARRNQRRRDQLGAAGGLERRHSIVRVHFSEVEPESMVIT